MNMKYRQLDSLLRDRKWKEADQELYRILIEAVGKSEGDYFSYGELEKFPYDLLHEVSGVWFGHTGSHGLDVQRLIFKKCGAHLGYDWDNYWEENKEAFRKFRQVVGWDNSHSGLHFNHFNGEWTMWPQHPPEGYYPIGGGWDHQDYIFFVPLMAVLDKGVQRSMRNQEIEANLREERERQKALTPFERAAENTKANQVEKDRKEKIERGKLKRKQDDRVRQFNSFIENTQSISISLFFLSLFPVILMLIAVNLTDASGASDESLNTVSNLVFVVFSLSFLTFIATLFINSSTEKGGR